MEKMLLSVKTEKLRGEAELNNGCVVAVGNFDGVHIGHRMLLERLAAESGRHGLPSAVFTFFEQDRPKMNVKQLAQYGEKSALLAENGVDLLVSAPFSLFRDMDAEAFALDFLFGFLGAKSVICGYDFRFGRDRKGDFSLIKRLLSPYGVEVYSANARMLGDTPVSSTLIRSLVSNGDIESANEMLGRVFSFRAPVCRGAQLGNTLGFPTANQKYPTELVAPRLGVYAVRCVIDGKAYGGVANFGVKPTVGGVTEPICETHIFGFDGDCYGKEAEIGFLSFIRDEMRFSSLDELKKQIRLDTQKAEMIISKEIKYD